MTKKQLQKYRAYLDDKDMSFRDVGIWADSFRPTKLYRYMRFDSHWKDNLIEGQFYLGLAENLNDPFDCLIYVNRENYAKYLLLLTKKLFPGLNNEHIISAVHDTIDDKLDAELTQMKQKFRVASLTETYLSPLMWAHYTDSHKGFCIEYDLTKVDARFRYSILPIIYSDSRYDATPGVITKEENICMNPLFFKSPHWKYEKEWRMVVAEPKDYSGAFYADFQCAISAVYFGLKSFESHSAEIHEVCAHYTTKQLPAYQMDIELGSYNLVRRQLN